MSESKTRHPEAGCPPARTDETGASAVEYGLLITGVAALIAAVVFLFGNAVLGLFDNTCNTINTQNSTHGGSSSSCS